MSETLECDTLSDSDRVMSSSHVVESHSGNSVASPSGELEQLNEQLANTELTSNVY